MRARNLIVSIAALAFPLLAAPAAAQPAEALDDSSVTVASIYRAGQCVVRRDRAAAIRVLEALPVGGEPQLQDAARTLAAAGCLDAPLPSDFPVLLRGAIAQEMLATDYPEPAAEPHSVQRLVDLRLPAESDGDAVTGAGRRYQWSDCVARNDRDNVERLLRAPVGSERERMLLLRMRPLMAVCMGQQEPFSASAPEIRSMLAQSTYHALRRYWTGDLASAGLSTIEDPNSRIICRTYRDAGSRVTTQRMCLTAHDWDRVRLTTREELERYIRYVMMRMTR